MTTQRFSLAPVDVSWKECLDKGLTALDPHYVQTLQQSDHWLPGSKAIFNAFSLPLNKVNYILFGESPYPRQASANGYAFWDAAVKELWSPQGLSKAVNRATSLRNFIKMLLIAEGLVDARHCTQETIAKLDKSDLIQTNDTLFKRLLQDGFLLLNATLVLQAGPPVKDARAWKPFMQELLTCLFSHRPHVKVILFGRIAAAIDTLLKDLKIDKFYAEHPYNISFITNQKVLNFFRPFHLLRA